MVNWNLIRSNGGTVSSAGIRKNIVSFITRHYPCSVVESIERKYNAYKICLINGLHLVFDAEGHYVKTH